MDACSWRRRFSIPAAASTGAHVVRLDDDGGRDSLRREHLPDLVVGLDHGEVLRQVVDAGHDGLQAERRNRQRDQRAAGQHERHHRTAHHAVDDRGPEPRLRAPGAPAREERNPPLVDSVSEPGQHRRQDGERGAHRDGDDEHRPDRECDEGLVAADQHSGHRDDHGQAGDQHGASRGRRSDLKRVFGTAAGSAAPRVPAAGRRASSRRRLRGRSSGSRRRGCRRSGRPGSEPRPAPGRRSPR